MHLQHRQHQQEQERQYQQHRQQQQEQHQQALDAAAGVLSGLAGGDPAAAAAAAAAGGDVGRGGGGRRRRNRKGSPGAGGGAAGRALGAGEFATGALPLHRAVTNVVLMGMGEPGYNYKNVKKAVEAMIHPQGLNLSRRRVTLSTSGVVPIIDRLGADLGINLAISLHAIRDDLRNELVPINRTFPLETLIEACRRYPGACRSAARRGAAQRKKAL